MEPEYRFFLDGRYIEGPPVLTNIVTFSPFDAKSLCKKNVPLRVIPNEPLAGRLRDWVLAALNLHNKFILSKSFTSANWNDRINFQNEICY